jgi:hypothetical protein
MFCRAPFLGFVVVASLLLAATPAVGKQASAKYDSCSALRQDFANGVAKNSAAARLAVRNGYLLPAVRSAVYRVNRGDVWGFDGTICIRLAPKGPTPAPAVPTAVAPAVPTAVANLGAAASSPVYPDTVARFTASWQMPTAAPVNIYEVTVNGQRSSVNATSCIPAATAVSTCNYQGQAAFSQVVTVAVVAVNTSGAGPASSVQISMPAAPKSTRTVEIIASANCYPFGNAYPFYSLCYISVTNASGGRDVYKETGSWSFELPRNSGISVFALVSGSNTSPATCTIKVDGTVIDTKTSTGDYASCGVVVR